MIPYFETTCVVPYYPNRRDVTAELEAAVLVISPRNNPGVAYDGYEDSVPESEQLESRSSRYDTHGSLAHEDRRTGQRRGLCRSQRLDVLAEGGRRCGSVLYRDYKVATADTAWPTFGIETSEAYSELVANHLAPRRRRLPERHEPRHRKSLSAPKPNPSEVNHAEPV